MSTHTAQAHIDAAPERVWELVGDPQRHPEWWPRVIDVRGEHFDAGAEYVIVVKGPGGADESSWLVEGREDLQEIRFRCLSTGTTARWLLTEARGGTFVDLELGMDPLTRGQRLFDLSLGRLYFSRWAQASVDALRDAARQGR